MNKKVQVIRCLAITAVVMIHSYGGGFKGVIIRPFINYAVAAFLFLSGYLTDENKVKMSWKQFSKKRIVRVLVPYTLWAAIYTITYGNTHAFLKNLITFSTNGSHYFIFVYIQMVLVTPLLIGLLNSRYKCIGFLISPLSVVILRYAALAAGWNLRFPFTSAFGGLWLSFYYLGLGLNNGKFKIKLSLKGVVLLYSLSLVLSITEGISWYHYGNYDLATTQLRITSVLSSMLACILAYMYIESDRKTWTTAERYAIAVGDYSFGIYFSHVLVINILEIIPEFSQIVFPVGSILILLLSLFCVMAGKRILGKKYAWYMGL